MKCPYCKENVNLKEDWITHGSACEVKNLSLDKPLSGTLVEPQEGEKNLDEMSVDELKEFAKEIELDLGKAKKKEAIILAIVDALDDQE